MADPVGEAIQRAKAHMLNEVWRPDLEESAKRTIELLETLRATDDDNLAAKDPLEVATERPSSVP